MCITRITIGIALLLFTPSVQAGTTLDFWHSYVNPHDHQTHYNFHLTQYKRGLFWGSCGPSTKSLQWSFDMDLTGDGPVYSSQLVTILDDNGNSVHVISGQVVTDLQQNSARIEIEIEITGSTNQFIGNGKYLIKKIK